LYIFPAFGAAKTIEMGYDLTELQSKKLSNVHCYVLWITAKM